MRVCVITDNRMIHENFRKLIQAPRYQDTVFDFFCSVNSQCGNENLRRQGDLPTQSVCLAEAGEAFFRQYDLFLSLHCKQMFPAALVNSRRCVNVHPGYNPYNRGWYPQVFAILNKLPVGVTIHEMDEKLDHGPVIVRREVAVHSWDTSYDVYNRIQQMEIQLLEEYLPVLLSGDYQTFVPDTQGNMNREQDFQKLCRLDLNRQITWREAIDLLRAMTFDGYQNAYFYDEENNKVYIEVHLSR